MPAATSFATGFLAAFFACGVLVSGSSSGCLSEPPQRNAAKTNIVSTTITATVSSTPLFWNAPPRLGVETLGLYCRCSSSSSSSPRT